MSRKAEWYLDPDTEGAMGVKVRPREQCGGRAGELESKDTARHLELSGGRNSLTQTVLD